MVDTSSSLFPFSVLTFLSILLNLPSHILHELVPNPLDLKMQMLTRISKLILTHPLFWRILGFVSSIVAFTCFALSPSFYDLFGRLTLLKIVIYSVISLILTTLMLLIKNCTRFSRSVLVRAHVGFLVMMLTSLCSIWQDRVSQKESDENGSGGRILNMCSFGAFGFMSLSLSRLLELGFEVGIFNFLFGSFLVLLMKMNFKLAPLAAILCYVIINIRSLSNFFMEKLRRADTNDTQLEDSSDFFMEKLRRAETNDTELEEWPHFFMEKLRRADTNDTELEDIESDSELEDIENVPEHSKHKGISDDAELAWDSTSCFYSFI